MPYRGSISLKCAYLGLASYVLYRHIQRGNFHLLYLLALIGSYLHLTQSLLEFIKTLLRWQSAYVRFYI